MFRRSRFSIRPNVGMTGRTAAAPQETPAVNKDADDTPKDVGVSNAATSESDNKSVVAQSEKPTTQGDGNDQNGEGTSTSAAVQRRKRFSVKPKVAPGRPSVAARAQRSPAKAASETPVPDSEHDKPTPTSHTPTTETSKGPLSPRNRRLSEESKQAKTQPKPSLIPSDRSEPSVVAPAEDSLNKSPEGSGKDIESTTGGQMKEVHFKVPDKVPSSLPDKEAIAISEKAKALVSSKTGLSPSPAAYTLSRLLNDPSDLQRLAKAQKLRELLKKEIHKEKRKRKASIRPKEFTLDPAKMTMRDLIHYLPESNPMTTSLEDPTNPENETIVPPSPERENSPERAQEPEAPPKAASPRVEEDEEEEEEDEAAEKEQEEALLVPQVKVAEDGSLIIDEESLTVEVQRAKGPNPAEDRDPIFERGSTTTYSSFRKGTYSKPWSSEETDMFFLAISMVGTDFSMICQLFPHRARSEIKNKFKKEERANAWRIDKAFRERRKLDIEYFSKLLEKILEVQKTRKKLKSLGEKNSPRKNKRKTKGKKAAKKLDDVEEEEEEDIPDLEGEEEGEKENEDLCNEGGTPSPKPKRKRKKKNEQSASTMEPHDKKNKADKKSSEQDEACIPEDAEAALPDDRADSELSEKAENVKACKDTAIKPAKLSRGRAPKPLLQLGRKRGKKPPTSPAETKDAASDNDEKSANDGATEDQTNEDASPKRQDNKRMSASDVSSEDEDVTDVHPPKPTRYGRTPKPTKPLNYPARDDSLSSSETTSTLPAGSATSKHKPKCTAKKRKPSKPPSVQESKKPKLFTLRASQSEYSDDEENENQWEEEQQPECSSTRDSSVFVPASLRSPHPVIAEVEETVEELDILVNMPDVLGISQDALCPDATCKLAQNETGLAEPCEHQLDLLVDVIDCLSSDYTVAEDESYNEAAHTLLTIGNLTHLSQLAENQTVTHDHAKASGTTSVSGENVASKPAAQDENSDTPVLPVTLDQGATEMLESAATVELHEESKDDSEDVSAANAASPQRSEKMSPQTRKGRSIKVKPKPNLGKASRSKKADCGQTHQEEASGSPESSVDQITSGATTLIQNTPETDCSHGAGIEEQATTESTDKTLKSEISNTNDSSDNLVTSSPSPSSLIQQSSDHPAPSVTPVEDFPASQREVSEGVSSPQTKKSGFHRVKPKPNLTKTARSAHSKPPITKDTEEKACSLTPDPKSHERPIEDAAAESTCTTSSEKSQSTISAPELKQSVDVESSLTRTVGPSTPVEKKAAVALVESSVAVSDGSTTENRSVPETSPESSQTSESTEETVTHIQATETSLGPGLDADSAPVKDTGDHCASGKTPVGELHASQKEDSPRPAGKSRFQKIKPKPNIALASRTVRPKLKTTGETVEKSSHPTPNPDIHDKMTGDREAEPAGITSPENTSCASDVIPSFDAAAALATTEKLDVGILGQVESSTATQTAIQEKAVPGSSTDSAPSEERVEGLPVSPEKNAKVTLTCLTGESEKVEPQPHLTARSALSKPPTSEGPVTNQKSVEEPASATQNLVCDKTFAEIETQPTCGTTSLEGQGQIEPSGTASLSELSLGSRLTHKPEESSSTGEQETDAESERVSTPEGSGRNVPPRRGRFARVKPNLASCTRKRSTRPQPDVSRKGFESRQADTSSDETSEQQSKSNSDVQVQLTEKDGEHLTSGNASLQTEAVSSTQLEPAQSQLNSQSSEGASAESEIKPADAQSVSDAKESAQQLCAETVPEVKSRDVIPQSSENKPPASHSEHDNESEPLKSSETSRKAPRASRGRLVKPKPNLGHCRRAQQQKAAQPKPDTATLSEGVDVSTSRATSEGHTGTQEPAEGATEQHINTDSSEVVEQLSELDFAQNVAGSSLSCLTQVDPSSQLQEESTFSTGENQSQPKLTIFSGMLPEPVPSDPDEPFFILSLTEIPLAEVVGGASEPLPCLADASKRRQNVPGDVLGGASDGSRTDVAVPVSTENVSETGLINVKETERDPAAYVGAVTENPVDPQASASVQPIILLETAAENEETECRAENKRQRSTQRRAKLQTKPKTSIEKPASEKTEATPTPLSEPFAPSVEPESSEQTATKSREESGDDADIEKDAITGWREPEDSGLKAKVKRAGSRRKQKGSASPSSDAPPCKTAPKGPEAKTPRSVEQRSSTAPVTSTSYDVPPTPAETQPSGETVPTPSPTREHAQGRTSCSTPCTAELLDFRQSDIQESSSKAEEEEPTNVSQYFLSDIFTEVEDE